MLRALALIASSPSFWRERIEVRVVRDRRGKSAVDDFLRV